MDNRREAAELHIDIHSRPSLGDVTASLWRGGITSARAALLGVLDALHESRRRQSAREIARHRHLIDAIHSRTDMWGGERK